MHTNAITATGILNKSVRGESLFSGNIQTTKHKKNKILKTTNEFLRKGKKNKSKPRVIVSFQIIKIILNRPKRIIGQIVNKF